MKVKCPTCRKASEFTPDNRFRPFCSERCQTLDLGAWADERYRVPLSEQEPSSVNENPESSEPTQLSPPRHQLN